MPKDLPKKKPETRHPPSDRPAPELAGALVLAKQVTDATGCPVVGGIAVALHGYRRYTGDIDIYSEDFWATHERLEAAGMRWDPDQREHHVAGMAIHMVKQDSLGGPPKHISTIEGVKVIGLADLIRGKLTVGLVARGRAKDIGDVLELIRLIPLKKDFAARLPTALRTPFKRLVDDVHGPRRTPAQRLKTWGIA